MGCGSVIFDPTPCTLGEGPLWHPGRQTLFWFDIVERRLFARTLRGETHRWTFPEMVSAAGIVDDGRLIIASETALSLFDIATGVRETLVPLEADNPITRSNDGRADPCGGFWIGTMGKAAETGAGSIWRYYKGEQRQLFAGITITNAICFAPDGAYACFCDTKQGVIMQVALDRDGWPVGNPEPFIDLREEGLNPDGAVIDADGNLWSAQWGAGRVARYDDRGRFCDAVRFPAAQVSCPAFGGPELTTLFATSAREGLDGTGSDDGCCFAVETEYRGQAEHRVLL